MAINDPRIIEMINLETGAVTQLSGNLYIPKVLKLKASQFLIMGSQCGSLDFRHCGALFKICKSFLHFNTLLLHKKDNKGNLNRLKLQDFESVLDRKGKAAGNLISGLVNAGALMKPDKRYRYYVSPKYIIRGGHIDCEEFHMLSKIDPTIIECLDDIGVKGYNNWKNAIRENVAYM